MLVESGAVRSNRDISLKHAVEDVKKWNPPADVKVGRHPSEQIWLEKFGPAIGTLDTQDVRQFLISFQLIRSGWDLDNALACIHALAGKVDFSAPRGVTLFAFQLGRCTRMSRQQTSAASKILNFLFPSSAIYIWDALAIRSAKMRYMSETRDGRSSRKPTFRVDTQHDYAAFHSVCMQIHKNECEKADFKDAVSHLVAHFDRQGGEIADHSRVPMSFIERRLLDKLMFWEGQQLRDSA